MLLYCNSGIWKYPCALHLELLQRCNNHYCSRRSSVSIVSGYGLDDHSIEVRSPSEAKENFSSSPCVQTGSGPTQPSVQWVPVVLSPWVNHGRGVTLTTHPHLVPRSKMSRVYTPSLPNASMACSGTDKNNYIIQILSDDEYIYFG
jgi:hypothetical protein